MTLRRTSHEQQVYMIYGGDRAPLGEPPCDGRVGARLLLGGTLRERLLSQMLQPCDLPAGHEGRHQTNQCGCQKWNFSLERCECEGMICGCW